MLEEQLVQYVTEDPRVVGGFVVGLVATAFNYWKTGKLPIGRLPYRYFRHLLRDFRNRYFGKSRPRGVPGIVADAGPDELDKALRPRHYEPADLFSYEYDGEVLNLRRPDGFDPDPVTGDPVAMENHIRGFALDSGKTFLLTHYEANRFSETSDHFDGENYSWERGAAKAADDLDELGLEYERVDSEAAAGVTVVS